MGTDDELSAVRLKLAKLEVDFLTFVKASNANMALIADATVTSGKNSIDLSKATANALELLMKRTFAIEDTLRSYDKRRTEVRRGAKT